MSMLRTWFNRYLVCPGATQNPPFFMWWLQVRNVAVLCFFAAVVPGLSALFVGALRQAWWFAAMGAFMGCPSWIYLLLLAFSKAERRIVLWMRLVVEWGLHLLMYTLGSASAMWALEHWLPLDS